MDKLAGQNEFVDRDRYLHVLDLWNIRAHKAAQAHYRESEICSDWNRLLTITNAILFITVLFLASATWIAPVFFDDSNSTNITYKLLVSLSSLLVVVTTILHYLFKYEERSGRHASSAQAYGSLLKKVERYGCSNVCDMDSLHIISKQYSSITNAAPLIPKKRWNSPELEEYSSHIQALEKGAQGDMFLGTRLDNRSNLVTVDKKSTT